jgi:hypothetical protein
MSAVTDRAFHRLASDARRVFGDRFVALIAYGSNASILFCSAIQPDDLDAMGPLVATWEREGLETPLVMTPEEFQRSLDAFPLEYQDILDHHTVIAGAAPFQGVSIAAGDLRRACETQARSHLLHLRQGWIQHAAHHDGLADLVARSAGPFRALLANVARLHGRAGLAGDDLVGFAETTIGMPAGVVRAVLDLAAHPDRDHENVPKLADYLSATERLWHFVDTWRTS